MSCSKFPYLKDESLSDWLAALGRKLECPVCLKTITDPPIYLCENQHGVCFPCRSRLKAGHSSCPVCRGQLTNKRNHMLEGILDTLPKTRCKYDCGFTRTDVELVKTHEKDCMSKPAPCIYCSDKVPMRSIYYHLMYHHYNKVMESSTDHVFVGPDGRWVNVKDMKVSENSGWSNQIPFKVNIGGQADKSTEFLRNWTEIDKNHVMFWISYCGSQKEANNYEFKIKIQSSRDKKNGKETFLSKNTARCVSCELSVEDMKDDKQGAVVFSKRLLREAADGNNQLLDYVLCIKNVSDNAILMFNP